VKRFTWTVSITVDETWVADGFDLTEERLHDIMARALPYAFGHEFSGKVLEAPPPNDIRVAQGYEPI
jgi:hypothetical protein